MDTMNINIKKRTGKMMVYACDKGLMISAIKYTT